MVVCAALIVPPDSSIYTPQELAHQPVALDYGNGTGYAGLQMLEGAMPREAITTCAAPPQPGLNFRGLMRGDYAATVLQEPWITAAEKAGCRLVSTTFFHGSWVAGPSVSAEAYAAFLRAIIRAVRRINADKRRYLHYFLPEKLVSSNPELAAITSADIPLGRIQVKEPGPIPEDEARWAWEWMAGWGVLDGAFDPSTQFNRQLEQAAYALAGGCDG